MIKNGISIQYEVKEKLHEPIICSGDEKHVLVQTAQIWNSLVGIDGLDMDLNSILCMEQVSLDRDVSYFTWS